MAKRSTSAQAKKPNIFMRIGMFIKQIVDELRKVVTPTSKELFFWALAVFIFVLFRDRYGSRPGQAHAVDVRLIDPDLKVNA